MEEIPNLKYPVSTRSFVDIRSEGYLYIDKTDLIWRLIGSNKYVFLSRPRRFGKSLLLSTIEAYFQGNRTLFSGLAIDRLKHDEWLKYPVIHLDLSPHNYKSTEVLENVLEDFLKEYERRVGIIDIKSDISSRFKDVIRSLRIQSGQKVVILIDEYDSPITQTIWNDMLQESFRDILHGFFSTLKSCDDDIQFCMLTGVTKYGKMSVFSGLNNLRDISFLNEYATICGITERELHTSLLPGVKALAMNKGISVEEAFKNLKDNYDGYHFSEAMIDVYNPYSLLNSLADSDIYDYWFETGTPTMLVRAMKNLDIDIMALDAAEASRQELNDISSVLLNPISLFYQTGYLTITGFDSEDNVFMLGFPNKEVKTGFLKCILPVYTDNSDSESMVRRLRRCLRNGEAGEFIKCLGSFLSDIPYDLRKNIAKYENYYHTLFYTIFYLIESDVHAEYHTSAGSIDLVIKTQRYVYIIELKLNGNASDAIRQINSKSYAAPFESGDREIIKIGIGFSKATNTIDTYEIVRL